MKDPIPRSEELLAAIKEALTPNRFPRSSQSMGGRGAVVAAVPGWGLGNSGMRLTISHAYRSLSHLPAAC